MDAKTKRPLVDVIVDEAGSKGTGVWTVQNSVGLGVPVASIAEAVFARAVSSKPDQRRARRATPSSGAPTVQEAGAHFEDDVQKALYASKIVAYAQGFDAIIAGALEYDWNIDKGAVARIWRGGCIIRAQFLNRIVDAYEHDPDIATLLEDDYFANAVADGEAAWRRVVATRRALGHPRPRLRLRAQLLRLAGVRTPARVIDPGPARLLRRTYLRAHRRRRCVSHALVGRPVRGRDRVDHLAAP